MKILEKKDSHWELEVICTSNGNKPRYVEPCGSKLLIDRNDLRYFEEQEFPWRIEPEAVLFKCPVCGNLTDLDESDWPVGYVNLQKFTSAWKNGEEL